MDVRSNYKEVVPDLHLSFLALLDGVWFNYWFSCRFPENECTQRLSQFAKKCSKVCDLELRSVASVPGRASPLAHGLCTRRRRPRALALEQLNPRLLLPRLQAVLRVRAMTDLSEVLTSISSLILRTKALSMMEINCLVLWILLHDGNWLFGSLSTWLISVLSSIMGIDCLALNTTWLISVLSMVHITTWK
jgi:hypothetical protein